MKTARHRIINFGIAVLSICICLLSAELAVRKIIPLDKGKSYEFRIPHPVLGWTLEPNAAYSNTLQEERVPVKYNSRGFHDVEHNIEKPEGVFRILILGDSFMEAYSVKLEDSFARRLEEFSRKVGLRTEVINLGTGGYGTLQEYLLFELMGKKYRPDLVLVGFYVENDLVNNSLELSSIMEKEKKRPFLDPDSPTSWKITQIDYAGSQHRYSEEKKHLYTITYKIASQSILLKLIYKEYRRMISRFFQNEDEQTEEENKTLRDLVSLGVYYCTEPPGYTRAWGITSRILHQLKTEVESINSRLVVFTAPSFLEVKNMTGMSSLCMEEAKPYKRLESILKEQGIDYIDLLPAFRKTARDDGIELFRRSDRHWNQEGHSLAARKVVISLTEE